MFGQSFSIKSLREQAESMKGSVAGSVQQVSQQLNLASSIVTGMAKSVVDEKLSTVVPEVKSLLMNPYKLGAALEEKNPWLGRKFLSIASNINDPFILGMGIYIESLAEDRIVACLPNRWRNRGDHKSVHLGALLTLAEFVGRQYWERHLSRSTAKFHIDKIQSRFFKECHSEVRAIFHFTEAERENALLRLRTENEATVETEISIFDEKEQMVSQVQIEWKIMRRLALGGKS